MGCNSLALRLFTVLLVLGQLHLVTLRDVSVSRGKNGNRMPTTRSVSMELPSPTDAKRRNALQDDVFYCRAVSIASDNADEYIINFSLNNTEKAPLSRAPTMLVFGCPELPADVKKLRDPTPLWDCRAICRYGERLLWTFSYEVGSEAFHLPVNSGYWVGGSSGIYYLVLQGKYDLRDKIDEAAFEELEKEVLSSKSKSETKSQSDSSKAPADADAGVDAAQRVADQISATNSPWRPLVTLSVSRSRPKRLVGVALLENTFGSLDPGSEIAYADASCAFKPPLRSDAQIVAFRVHSHSIGRLIEGYLFNGSLGEVLYTSSHKNTNEDEDYETPAAAKVPTKVAIKPNSSIEVFKIGDRDPRLPQVFVPARAGLVVHERDLLFARCAYDTSTRTRRTDFGSRPFDEMCNFFAMYTFEAAELDSDPIEEQYDTETAREFEEYGTLREEADSRDQLPLFMYCERNDYKKLFEQLVPRVTSLAQADIPDPADDDAGGSTGHETPKNDVQTDGAFTLESVRVNKSRVVAAGRHLIADPNFRLAPSTVSDSLTTQLGFTAYDGFIGQICGVATDSARRIYIFHRATLSPTRFLDWLKMPHLRPSANASTKSNPSASGAGSFPLIAQNTVAVLDADGKLLESFGANRFALPRAVHVDSFGLVYLADSVHHSITVFSPTDRKQPARVFGAEHLCGPSSIVTDADPESVDQLGIVHTTTNDQSKKATSVKYVYIADGDCLGMSPSRVVQFAADGSFIAELRSGAPHGVLLTAHALGDSLALAAPTRLTLHGPFVCVTNREHANVVCWSRRDAALATAIDVSSLGDRLVAATSVGDTFHLLAGTAVFCGAKAAVNDGTHATNRSEEMKLSNSAKLDCGKMAGYTFDARTGDVTDIWHGSFDVPIDMACAHDGSFVVVAELYPVANIRKFVLEPASTPHSRTLGDLMAATAGSAPGRREKDLPLGNGALWSIKSVSAVGGALIAFFVIANLTCCAGCVACCCKKLRSSGLCGVKLSSRRRESPVKLNVGGEPLIGDTASLVETGGMVTDVAQMANEVVAKWRVGIADLKDAVSGGAVAPRRGGFAALPQNDNEADEIIDSNGVEELELEFGGAVPQPTARVSLNENVRRAQKNDRDRGNEDAPSGAHVRFEHSGASKKVRFAVNRNGDLQDGATA